MDSDRLDCLVENSGLDVAPRRVENPIKQGEFQYVRRGIGQSARVPWPQCWQPHEKAFSVASSPRVCG